jgi:hypothetical protein
MIVRKYCKGKRARESSFAKEKNKKDLMRGSEMTWRMGLVPFWYSAGIGSPRSPALRDRYDRRYFGDWSRKDKKECG